jgi:hypothetical protein
LNTFKRSDNLNWLARPGLAMEADTGVGDTVYYGGTTQQSARV